MPIEHSDIGLGEIHIVHNWEYANAAARTGATGFIASDVGKWAKQTDDGSFWELTAITPTWAQRTGLSGPTINPTDDRIPYRFNETGFADSFLAHDAANGQTTAGAGHFMLSQNLGKVIGFGNTTIAFGALKAGAVGSMKVVADDAGNPGTLYNDWATLANPGGNWAPFMSLGMKFYKQLTSNITMAGPAVNGGVGVQDGYEFEIMFQQDGTGGWTITWNAVYKFEGGTVPTPTATANAIDWYRFIVRSGNAYCTDVKFDLK